MKELQRQAGHGLRRHVRKFWESRGGGFYGFVATLTFLYLETVDLAGDVIGFPALVAADLGGVIGWAVSNIVNAVLNLVKAVIWPVDWIGRFGLGLRSALLLGAAYVAYRAIRPFILRLLRDPEEPAPAPARPL